MMTEPQIAILLPSALGAVSFVCTTVIHALPLGATVNYIRRERSLGRAGAGFWIDVAIVARTISYAMAAHLTEIGLWGVLFVFCREFRNFGTAYYHSAVDYTTLGYGDVVMSPAWRLLGSLESEPACRSHDRCGLDQHARGAA
jgi:hypothetical protein